MVPSSGTFGAPLAKASSARPQLHPQTRTLTPKPANVAQTLTKQYGGDRWYAGYAEMYDAVRARAPKSIVIIGGTGWSYDAVGPLAIFQQYKKEHSGAELENVMYNLHV